MTARVIVDRNEWLEARIALLEKEKDFTKAREVLAAERRQMPWVKVVAGYALNGADGKETLGDLFGGKSQLIVQHFMLGDGWEAGCPSCSFWADGYDRLDIHLANRDTAFAAVSNTSLDKIERYRARMGWTFRWVSSMGSDFNRDFHVSFTPEEIESGEMIYNYTKRSFPATEAPGFSVFHKPDANTLVHTYSTYARGLDHLIGTYQFLDLVPKGRDEDDLDFSMAWIRRHDNYED